MNFGSATFLAFLLAVVVVYNAVPVRARWGDTTGEAEAMTGGASSVSGASTSGECTPGTARPSRHRRAVLAAALVASVAPLVVCEYTDSWDGRSTRWQPASVCI